MRKFSMAIFCLTICILFATTSFAESPAEQQIKWQKAGEPELINSSSPGDWPKGMPSISVDNKNLPARLKTSGAESANESMDGEILYPNIYWGWGPNGDKYGLYFYGYNIHPFYFLQFMVNSETISYTVPIKTYPATNNPDFEPILFKEARGGVNINQPGEYNLEIRVYINHWQYFVFRYAVDVPHYQIWLSNVCYRGGKIQMSYNIYPNFGLEVMTGDVVELKSFKFNRKTKIQSVDTWGNATFTIAVWRWNYKKFLENKSLETEFFLTLGANGPTLTCSQNIYYWEPGGYCQSAYR